MPVVSRRVPRRALGDAHLLEPRGRAEAFERVTGGQQLIGILFVDARTFALTIRSKGTADVGALVPRESAPAQRGKDDAFALRGAASLIGVLDAQHELPAVLAGKAVVDERDIGRADVRIAGR